MSFPTQEDTLKLLKEMIKEKNHNITDDQLKTLSQKFNEKSPREINTLINESFFSGPFTRSISKDNHFKAIIEDGATKYQICNCNIDGCGIKVPDYNNIEVKNLIA